MKKEKATIEQPPYNVNDNQLHIYGAREHNLKNIDLSIPRNQLVVITGLSGSGKSSLAFDTIYAEGQRRYMETFSAYARQFVGNMERPDVDNIEGLSPVISIEQKTTNKNPRSTVGTVTEIYDFLRLLFARASDAYSRTTGKKMIQYSESQIIELITQQFDGEKISILAPLVRGRKGHYNDLFQTLIRQGYLRVRVNGEIQELNMNMRLDRYKTHTIELVVSQTIVGDRTYLLIEKAIKTALKQGKNALVIMKESDKSCHPFSSSLMCTVTGESYDLPEPNTFSFNSPYGACPHCKGLGKIERIDIDKIFPNPHKSVSKGGIAPISDKKTSWIYKQIETILQKFNYTTETPVGELSKECKNFILYGSDETLEVKASFSGVKTNYSLNFSGLVTFIEQYSTEDYSYSVKKWVNSFMNTTVCPECEGSRLKKECTYFKIAGKSIIDLAEMDLIHLKEWTDNVENKISERKRKIGHEIILEIRTRIGFLLDVGIDYLSLNRPAASLSGGESQRIRLASQIGSKLEGVLYILDEPSIGLHQRDNLRLIDSLMQLKDIGNSVIVVEHDEDMMKAADHIIDIGPGAGRLGGEVVAQGSYKEILKQNSVTCKYLQKKLKIEIPKIRRKGNGNEIILTGASGNNLKNVKINLPLGQFVCVSGVSGSGKSSLINDTLFPILSQHFYKSNKNPLAYKTIKGLEYIDKVIDINQSPIGRTPRSNPATYVGVFTEIRNLFAQIPEAKIRGYKAGRFSFNVKGGRCEECQGAGVKLIEMNFLPDVRVLCEKCNGFRYNRETLEIRYKGKSINDVLNMTINQAVEFFEHIPSILIKLKSIQEVGLGYIKLGQSSTTLSGGEAQRVKLATELSKRSTGKTLLILDEPTTGLHFEDIKVLLEVLNILVEKGNSVIVIEHNMDVIKMADHVIDMGPDGGYRGGKIIATGTPEEVAKNKNSITGEYLLPLL